MDSATDDRPRTRNKLTDYWKEHEIKKEAEFAILTDIIHREWAGLKVQEHKSLKGLKCQNLRDHMSETELIFTALAGLSTRQIAETMNATGMVENKVAGKKGGGSALIEQWLKNKDTVLFLGVWEHINNPVFNSLEFEGIKNEAGRNSFFLSALLGSELTCSFLRST